MDVLVNKSNKILRECKWETINTFTHDGACFKKMFKLSDSLEVFCLEEIELNLNYICGFLLSSKDVIVNEITKCAPSIKELKELEHNNPKATTLRSEDSAVMVRVLSGVKAKRVSKAPQKLPSRAASVVSALESEPEVEEDEEDEDEEEDEEEEED